jgi:hypothetical protein
MLLGTHRFIDEVAGCDGGVGVHSGFIAVRDALKGQNVATAGITVVADQPGPREHDTKLLRSA